jgi:hypothetical protein
MRYMMLIRHDTEAMAKAPQGQLWTEYAAFNEALSKAGAGFAAGERLGEPRGGATVRNRQGKTDVLDGPYADSHEQLAGYYFIDVPTLEEAVKWAGPCPSAQFGSVEIRPLMGQSAS